MARRVDLNLLMSIIPTGIYCMSATRSLQLTPPCSSLSSYSLVWPIKILASVLRSQCHASLAGLSSFCPGGSTWRVFLWCWWLVFAEWGLSTSSCWPSAPSGFSLVCCHSSSLLILSGYRMLRICFRQLLMNVWIFLLALNVEEPDLCVDWQALEPQMFLSFRKGTIW